MERIIAKCGLMWIMTLIMVLSIVVITPELSVQTEAASKKVTSANSLTGSRTIYLAKGKKAALKTTVTVTPNTSANRKVTYKSSDKKVATVTSKGVITGKKAETAKITATSKKNSKKKATVTVKVVKGKVTSIKLNETSGILTVGDSVTLKATVKISKGGKKNVVWTSSNVKVATVKGGTIKAVGAGTATITVKAADGTGKKATYKVTVKDDEEGTTTTEDTTPEKPTTEETTTTEGKNASAVAILQQIIQEQIALGANVPTDLNASEYTWNENGRLTELCWERSSYSYNLKGTLSFEGLTALESFCCTGNDGLSGLDMSGCTSLTTLSCDCNRLSSLDVSGCTSLITLCCEENELSSLDVSKNIALTTLWCSGNGLNGLDVSTNTELTTLYCGGNWLSSLDVSTNTALTYLYCYHNYLSSLDVSSNKALIRLVCSGNRLSSLDVSKNISLAYLDCTDNPLSSLNVSNCDSSLNLECDNTVDVIR